MIRITINPDPEWTAKVQAWRAALPMPRTVKWWVYGLLALVLVWSLLAPTDATDGGRLRRSGLKLYVDYDTGCHYIETPRGGLTPRLENDGTQICSGPIKEGGRGWYGRGN